MKKWIWIIVLTCLTSPAYGFDINAGISGSWFNPNRNGHGFAVEYTEVEGACDQVNNQGCLVVYWFTYNKEGDPIFLLGVLPVDGNVAEGELFYFSGLQFGSFMGNLMQQSWGTLRLRFTDCNGGFAVYESGFVPPEGAPFDQEGQFPISRLAFVSDLECTKAERVKNTPNTLAAGFYFGTAVSRDFSEGDSLQSASVAAIIRENGEAWFLWPGFSVFHGQLTGDGLALSGQLDAVAGFPGQLGDGETSGTVQITTGEAATIEFLSSTPRPGRARAGDFLEGHWSGLTQEGDFRLTYKVESNRPPELSSVANCWLPRINGSLGTPGGIEIMDNGNFSFEFSDEDGETCGVQGSVQPAGEGWNLFETQVQLSECQHAGSYEGVMVGHGIASSGGPSQLFFITENGSRAFLSADSARLDDDQCE